MSTNTYNPSLETTLRDNRDGLEEFSLMVAASSMRPHYEMWKPKPQQALRPPIVLKTPVTSTQETPIASLQQA
jgi:hypothetical protein